jgi:uncharacterized protein DUF6476
MEAATANTRNMRPLVAVVIIMGVLIVIGLIVVIATIAHRVSGDQPVAAATALPSFAASDLPIPAGCEVRETTTAESRLILRLGTGERCNRVLIVDMASGKLLGTLRLVPNAQ